MSATSPKRRIPALATVAVLALVGGAAVMSWSWLDPDSHRVREASDANAKHPGDTPRAAALAAAALDQTGQVISLPDAKLAAAQIKIELAARSTLVLSRTVPGRVAYNDNRHIELKTPTTGVMAEVLVKPGDGVKAGQLLAQLNSSQIGTSRADVLQRQAEAQLADQLLARTILLEQNVNALVTALKQRTGFEGLKDRFAGRALGDYRQRLLAAYSRLLLAESVAESSGSLAGSGVLARRTQREREAESRSAHATLEAACEQAELDVWKELASQQNTARDAARRLQIARQHLAAQLLTPAATKVDVRLPESSELGASDRELERLSLVAVRAPFGGTIESRSFSVGERVQSGDSLFVLADTRSLWIKAEIRENNWPAVGIEAGRTVTLIAPALGDRELTATVYFVGREVSAETNAIPVIAEIDNLKGLLRPGLFVRVTVPVDTRSDVVTVSRRAVLRHDEQAFVFVREAGNRFRRVDVETGIRDGDRVEIVSGLKAGLAVVSNGAFFLKSELLLESQGE